ncbi:MAG: amidohydrolase family protein [Planctomycetota bacterium]
MSEIPLHHVWTYTDVDRAFWHEHLEDWVPRRIIDAHVHVSDPDLCVEPLTEEMRRQYWVNEVYHPMGGDTAERCAGVTFPGRRVTCVAMGSPTLRFDLERGNEYVRDECRKRRWHGLVLLRPEWSAERVAEELDKPGVIGVKPYYALIGYSPLTRDEHLEASIFDFLPHRALEVLDARRAWVTLHVPKADRLGHPDNLREIKEIRERYPNVILVIAHYGRSYTLPHAREGLPPLADDARLYFDCSAVLNPEVHRYALELVGPQRVIYGTDNPVFYMRGRRRWEGRRYINHTSYPFHFNTNRETPEIEATYTLYMYEALRAIKQACERLGFSSEDVRAIFHDNAQGLIRRVGKGHP